MRSFHKLIPVFIILLVLTPLFFQCERHGPVEPETPSQATLSSIQLAIFTPSCAVANCHVGNNSPLGLDLSDGNSYDNLVNIPSGEIPSLLRVEPNNPDSSYLVLKVEGAPNIVAGRMPLGGQPLTQQQIDLIREWINGGAPNN